MIFKDFCREKDCIFSSPPDCSATISDIRFKLTENVFIDWFLEHELQKLMTSEETGGNLSRPLEDLKEEFQFMLEKLIGRIPLYNLRKKSPSEYERDEFESKQTKERENIKKKCMEWFSDGLYTINPSLCEKLAPIIAFILVDSYPSLNNQLKKGEQPYVILYEYITDCMKGIYQEQYLFSIINGSQNKKHTSIELGNKCLQSILNKTFKFTCRTSLDFHKGMDQQDDSNINSDAEQDIETEIRPIPRVMVNLWNGIICCRACNATEEKYLDLRLESFFKLLKSLRFYNTLSSYATNRKRAYSIPNDIWSNLLEFENSKGEVSCFNESGLDGARPDYLPAPSILGENLIALICYLNDLERARYFDQKYEYAIILYTLNKMTQWVSTFTTRTIQNIIPEYNSSYLFTCDYYNTHIMKTKMIDKWDTTDKNEFKNNKENCYRSFMTWYSDTSFDEKTNFIDYVQKCAKNIFFKFIYCPNDRIFFPATTLYPEERSKKGSNKHRLSYFYCLYSRFYDHIVPQIEKSFTETCKELLKNNSFWIELNKKFPEWENFSIENGKKGQLKIDLNIALGESLEQYLYKHLKRYLDIHSILTIDIEALGGILIMADFDNVMEKYKEDIQHQPELKYLYPFLPQKSNAKKVPKSSPPQKNGKVKL